MSDLIENPQDRFSRQMKLTTYIRGAPLAQLVQSQTDCKVGGSNLTRDAVLYP